MRLHATIARERFAAARVARLATSADSEPHVVPVTFAVDGDVLAFAVDHKPKTSTALRRLHNIEANPKVSALVDEYHEDWNLLWWARADGIAAVLPANDPGARAALGWLRAKYEQYRERPPEGPVVLVDVRRWSGWTA
ncbi:MAG: TIGR03668 family PPOX class F420-dependent oxidoreductase [Thermocrispum sp.]